MFVLQYWSIGLIIEQIDCRSSKDSGNNKNVKVGQNG